MEALCPCTLADPGSLLWMRTSPSASFGPLPIQTRLKVGRTDTADSLRMQDARIATHEPGSQFIIT